jgi:D-methionine transport system substrate-binding protein
MKKFWVLPSSLLIVSILIVGEALARGPAKAELKVGFVSGPYIDEFKAGIEPELKQKGYAIRHFEFSTGLEANNAVFKGDIDANVMQHTVFLNSYNERQKTDLFGIVHVPTPPMGLYSKKHAPGTPIKPGSTVAVPNDPVNLQRALWILRDLGLVEIRESKPVDVTELDVIKNFGGIRIATAVYRVSGPSDRTCDVNLPPGLRSNWAASKSQRTSDAICDARRRRHAISVLATGTVHFTGSSLSL